MSNRNGLIEFDWADGTYRFCLANIKELEEHDEKLEAGPNWVFLRIEAGMWHVKDLAETIRLGLIGGGKTPEEARTLVRRYVYGRPHWESIIPAQKILAAIVAGPEDEPLKKVEGAAMETESSRSLMADSVLPPSMETAP